MEYCEDEMYSGILQVNRKVCNCVLTSNRLFWKAYNNYESSSLSSYEQGYPVICSEGDETILLSELIVVNQLDSKPSQPSNLGEKVAIAFGRGASNIPYEFNWEAIHVKRGNNFKWRPQSVIFSSNSPSDMRNWISHIQKALTRQTLLKRPQNLLVFINPIGGLKKGPEIYDHKVAPLFATANIKTNVIVTNRANHARDVLLEEDLTSYDGVVCVGGDGMFSELAHGLLLKANQYSSNQSLHGPVTTNYPTQIRIGLIPAGSTDTVAYSVMGTTDPVTAALHIILGDDTSTDVLSIHRDGHFVGYTVSMLGYGFYGDLIADSESHRWMGPLRYDWLGLKKFLVNNAYYGDVEYLESCEQDASHPRDNVRCGANCGVCDKRDVNQEESSSSNPTWKSISDKFVSVSASLITCRCARSPTGASPYAHLSDGCADLIMVRKCSRPDFLRHLLRIADPVADQFDFPFVTVKRVRAFRFTPRPDRRSFSSSSSVLSSRRNSRGSYISTASNLDEDSGIVVYSEESPMGSASRINKSHSRQSSDVIFEDSSSASPTISELNKASSRDVSSWNCDGESLEGDKSIDCRVHRKMIRVFARGIEF